MRIGHFEALEPRCPVCRARGTDSRLALGPRLIEKGDDVIEGALLCSFERCQAEFPIIDGIPFVVPDVRGTIAAQIDTIRARTDFTGYVDSLLGDCAGPDSALERSRYQASSYGRSHWDDLDEEDPGGGGFARVAGAAIELCAGDLETPGVWVDLGCGPGRASFELAARTEGLVVGIDLNVAMLRIARGAAAGRVEHPLRRVGLAYDKRWFGVDVAGAERVDFWACDVMALPFAGGTFAGALALNVIDCVASPLAVLRETGRTLAAGRPAVIASPFDWATSATPIEGWIGGHSQRGPQDGESDLELARLLAAGDPAAAGTGLVLEATRDSVDWTVYVHARAEMRYRCHMVRARRAGE